MTVANAIQKMILFYAGNRHEVAHFLKVWAYARTIGIREGLDPVTQQTLELAAVVHDIACPLCREKYGHCKGPVQELEGPPLARQFFEGFGLEEAMLDRICHLVGVHHTTDPVEGIDHRILLEADFLVNADEGSKSEEVIRAFRDQVFRTHTGLELLRSIYKL